MIPEQPEAQRLLVAEYVLGLHSREQSAEIEQWLEQDDDAASLANHWNRYRCRRDYGERFPGEPPRRTPVVDSTGNGCGRA